MKRRGWGFVDVGTMFDDDDGTVHNSQVWMRPLHSTYIAHIFLSLVYSTFWIVYIDQPNKQRDTLSFEEALFLSEALFE